jgi:hypothetical protein
MLNELAKVRLFVELNVTFESAPIEVVPILIEAPVTATSTVANEPVVRLVNVVAALSETLIFALTPRELSDKLGALIGMVSWMFPAADIKVTVFAWMRGLPAAVSLILPVPSAKSRTELVVGKLVKVELIAEASVIDPLLPEDVTRLTLLAVREADASRERLPAAVIE